MTLDPVTLPPKESAEYVGCKNERQFLYEVGKGIWPKPLPIKSRPRRWCVEALRQKVAELAGIVTETNDNADPELDQRLREFDNG